MISRRTDVNLPDNRHFYLTPLIWAILSGDKDIVNMLIRAGADVNRTSNIGKTTPLYTAVEKNRFDLVRILLFAGADPNGEIYNGRTPIFTAVRKGFYEIAQSLIIAGADTNRLDHNGDSLMKYASRENMVKLLTDARENKNE